MEFWLGTTAGRAADYLQPEPIKKTSAASPISDLPELHQEAAKWGVRGLGPSHPNEAMQKPATPHFCIPSYNFLQKKHLEERLLSGKI